MFKKNRVGLAQHVLRMRNPVRAIDEFLDDQDKRKIAVLDENVLTFNKIALRPRPLIVQLHYWPKAAEKKDEKKK